MEKRGKEIILLVLAAILIVVAATTLFRPKKTTAPPVSEQTVVEETAPDAQETENEKAELPTAEELLERSPGTSPKRNPFASSVPPAGAVGAPAGDRETATDEADVEASGTGDMPPLSIGDSLTGGISDEPDILTLKGVIFGKNSLALLRKGEMRYFVFRGSRIDNQYVVSNIGRNSVTLRTNDGNQIVLHLGGGR